MGRYTRHDYVPYDAWDETMERIGEGADTVEFYDGRWVVFDLGDDDFITYGNDDTEHLMSNPANAERLLESILQARGDRYGAFADNAFVAQHIKRALNMGRNALALSDDQREALHQIASKISRIVTGDPDYVDNWDDIAGYAKLVADRLRSDEG